MKLKVIHLLRRLERIERDLEELDGMLAGLRMDREYSVRLRDSLIEESARLKEFKQQILTQRVLATEEQIAADQAASESIESSVTIELPGKAQSNSNGKTAPAARKEPRKAEKKTPEKQPTREKESAFEFRFE
ncbi:MAG: hypothetical protein KDK37_06485 [Leptospiraceae bacterium]|nr:hypothetical protein [Leptospiraceae bacterium]